jgi:hypothetical protein
VVSGCGCGGIGYMEYERLEKKTEKRGEVIHSICMPLDDTTCLAANVCLSGQVVLSCQPTPVRPPWK